MAFEKYATLQLQGLNNAEYNNLLCQITGTMNTEKLRYPVKLLKTGERFCVRPKNLRFLETDFYSVVDKLVNLYQTKSNQPDFVMEKSRRLVNVPEDSYFDTVWKISKTVPRERWDFGDRVDLETFCGTWNEYRQAVFSCSCSEIILYLWLLYSIKKPKFFKGRPICGVEVVSKWMKIPPECNVSLETSEGSCLLNYPCKKLHLWFIVTLVDGSKWHVDPSAHQYRIHHDPFYIAQEPIPGCEGHNVIINDFVLRTAMQQPYFWIIMFHLRVSKDKVVSLAHIFKHNVPLEYVLGDFKLKWKPLELQYVLKKFEFYAKGDELFFTELI